MLPVILFIFNIYVILCVVVFYIEGFMLVQLSVPICNMFIIIAKPSLVSDSLERHMLEGKDVFFHFLTNEVVIINLES